MRKIVRRDGVIGVTGMSASTVDRLEAAGDFPKRIRLAANLVGWFSDEIEKWLETRARGISKAPVEANKARRRSCEPEAPVKTTQVMKHPNQTKPSAASLAQLMSRRTKPNDSELQ